MQNYAEETEISEYDDTGQETADTWSKRPTLKFITSMLLFMLIAACLIWTVYIINNGQGEIFSEFYVLGKDNSAQNYPAEVKLGDAVDVSIGIINHEYARQTYLLEISVDGALLDRIGPLSLENGNKWEQVVSITPVRAGNSQKAEFTLYRQIQNSKETNKPLSLQIFFNVN